MIKLFDDIRNNVHALRIQFVVTIKTTVATTRLGALWWVLDPLILMLLYTFVVKIIFERGGPDYHLFALCGIVTWQTFSRSVTLCSTALIRNARLIKNSNFPMHLYVMLPSLVQSFFYFIGLAIVAVWKINVVNWHTLAILPLLLPMILIPYTAGLFLSILTVNVPDIGKIIPYVLRFGFYLSPVLYPAERVYELPNITPLLKFLYALNPMVHVITAVREVLLAGEIFSITNFIIILAITLILMQVGIVFFRHYATMVPKKL